MVFDLGILLFGARTENAMSTLVRASEATPTCIKTGTRHGANRLTFGKRYDITNSPTKKNLTATFKMINKLGGDIYD